MRKLLKSMKTLLLVAAGLCVGTSNAWAVEVTTTIDFDSFVASSTPDITLGSDAISQSGTNALTVYQLTNNGTNFDRIALSHTNKSGVQKRWMFRNGSTYQKGLCGNWNSKGTANDSYNLSVLDLKGGDKITITWDEQANKGAGPKFCSAGVVTSGTPATDNEATSTMANGTTYTMKNDGNLDLYSTNNNLGIHTIVIVSTGTEEVTQPTLAITGASGYGRKVTITAGASNASNAVTTYYTTDGSEPTTSSPNYFTTASQVITVGENATEASNITVKALTVSSANTASEIASSEISVGTKVTLAAPSISFFGFTKNGSIYNPTYSFTADQSGVVGSPTPTLSYSFNGGDAKQGNSYTSTTAGTLVVTATVEGYEPNSTEMEIIGGNFTQSYTFDATTSVTVDTSVDDVWGSGGDPQLVNGAGWSFASLDHCTYTLRSDMSLSNFAYARATTANTMQGFYVRGSSKGVINYTLADGEYIMFTTLNSKILANSSTTSKSFDQYVNVREINVYTPLPSLTDGDAVKITFNNATSGSNYYDNWIIDFYSGNSNVAKVRADWFDEIANTNTLFTYGYTYSSDGGNTADNTNIWGTYVSDMANADIDLTVSYSEGTLYVIGTMTNGQKVYYVNYKKEGFDGDLTYNLYGNNASLSNISVASASVVTTPVHPDNVAVTLGTNGYTTYANNVYPLDLSNAQAYKAAVDGDKVKFTLFEQAVPVNTGMLVEGQGTVNLPIADTWDDVNGNEFLVNAEGNTFNADGNTTYYAMIKNSSPLKFGTFNPGTLAFPASKAYLKVAAGTPAKALMAIFDGDVTGITQVENKEQNTDNAVFNVAGQRVSRPTKGLYIVNGMKVYCE